MIHNYRVKDPNAGNQRSISRGKGVTGNGESEGSPRQSPELNESEPVMAVTVG